MDMLSISDLRIISEGADADFLQAMNESCVINEGVYSDSLKLMHGKKAKELKDLTNEARKLARKDPKEALKKLDAAEKLAKELRKEANDLPDDKSCVAFIMYLVKAILPTFIYCAVPMNLPVLTISSCAYVAYEIAISGKVVSELTRAMQNPDFVVKRKYNEKTKNMDIIHPNKEMNNNNPKTFTRAQAYAAFDRSIEAIGELRVNIKENIKAAEDK